MLDFILALIFVAAIALLIRWLVKRRKKPAMTESAPSPQTPPVMPTASQPQVSGFCPNCGKPTGPNADFCANCGTRLG